MQTMRLIAVNKGMVFLAQFCVGYQRLRCTFYQPPHSLYLHVVMILQFISDIRVAQVALKNAVVVKY